MSEFRDRESRAGGALFDIEPIGEDDCVWILIDKGDDAISVNLGPRAAVAGKWWEWLAGYAGVEFWRK
ncbi:MAG TPA: hypothetical protein VIT38_00575 [Allosphingosinicella sp.]|jgi:hypothetical protein